MKLGRSEERGCETVRELRHVDLAKVASISWADKVSNKEVLTQVGEKQQVLDIIRSRWRRWRGHTLRHGDLLTIVMEGKIRGRRLPG